MPICWPFLENCSTFRFLTPVSTNVLLLGITVIALTTATLFARKDVAGAFYLLAVLIGLKLAILLQDFRLILNEHYMALWASMVFLLVPHKLRVLRYLIVSFYWWAGTLKINHEWLSGAALYGRRPLGLPTSLIPASCAYVLVLELVMVFGLLSSRRWLFVATLVQLGLFHLASFWVVGFFYPILMFLLLTVFVLARTSSTGNNQPEWGLPALVRGKEAGTTYALLMTFSVFQLIPLAFPGDSALTGEGRLFALHMFDAPVECKAQMILHGANDVKTIPVRAPFLNPRISCDPIVYFSVAKFHCDHMTEVKNGADFDLVLKSRRVGAPEFLTVISLESFCKTAPKYDFWRHNWWIGNGPVGALTRR